MTTVYPASEDNFSRPTASSSLSGHAALHDDLADAIEAIENKVGVDNDTNTASHDYKIAQLESAPPSHNHGDLYYTETEVDGLLASKQDSSTALTTSTTFGGDVSGTYNNIQVSSSGHNHDDRYYTESEVNASFAPANHGHTNMITGKRGNGSFYVDGNGYATITHGLGATPVAAFVQTRAQITTGAGGGETVIFLPITSMSSSTLTFRAYEADAGNNNNSGYVSTIFDTTPGDTYVNVSWLVLS